VARNSASDLYGHDEHQWFYSEDEGQHWNPVDNSNSPDLTVSSETPKTVYFQDTCQVMPKDLNPLLFSTVAAVHFTGKEVPTTGLTIDTDEDTVYVNEKDEDQSIFAHATVTPNDATDINNIRWSSSDPSMGKVDPLTGEITVNGETKTGQFDITATINNISSSKTIYVKKMLTGPEYIFPGQNAIFELHGDAKNSQDYKVKWFLISKGITIPLTENFGTVCNLPPHYVNMINDGAIIYATVTETKPADPKHPKTIESNHLVFNIIKGMPVIDAKQTIFKESNSSTGLTNDSQATDVVKGDKLLHKYTLTNKSPDAKEFGKLGHLDIPLAPQETVNEVKIGDKVVPQSDLQITQSADQNDIQIPLTLSDTNPVTVEVTTDVGAYKVPSFEYKPTYIIDEFVSKHYSVDFLPVKATFLPDPTGGNSEESLELHPQNLNYGTINNFSKKSISRVTPTSNQDVLTFVDTRKEKSGITISLDYSNNFLDKDNNPIKLPLSFEFFDENHELVPSADHKVILEQTENGEDLQPIKWKKTQGLQLQVGEGTIPSGTYSSQLTWTYSDSV
jgi:hypothetical protein